VSDRPPRSSLPAASSLEKAYQPPSEWLPARPLDIRRQQVATRRAGEVDLCPSPSSVRVLVAPVHPLNARTPTSTSWSGPQLTVYRVTR